jgi:hypothetical protein
MMGRSIMGKETNTAGAAGKSVEREAESVEREAGSLEAGNAGMTVEERLKARGAPAADEVDDGQDQDDGEVDDGEVDDGRQTPDADQDEEDDGADGEIKEGEVEGLSPQAQAKINKRIHKLNIRRKDAESKAEQAESQLKALNERIKDENVQAAIRLGFDPNYINAEDAKKLNRVENLRAWRSFYRAHRENGYEGSGEGDDRSLTAVEVARRLDAVEDELLDIGGSARALARERLALKDADAAVGRAIRLGRQAPAGAGNAPPKKVNPKPPRLPAGGDSASRRPPISAGAKNKPAFDKGEFEKDGGDKNALEKQYQGIY